MGLGGSGCVRLYCSIRGILRLTMNLEGLARLCIDPVSIDIRLLLEKGGIFKRLVVLVSWAEL
jgi:hypothetical protein